MSAGGVEVRRGDAADLDEVVALERATEFAPHWPRDSYAKLFAIGEPDELGEAQRALFVARTNGRLVGFAVVLLEPRMPGCGCADEERTAEVESIAVTSAVRRAGVGKALVGALVDWSRSEGATELVLEVRESSAAVQFYRALGFDQTGRRRAYYRDPAEDALLMRLALR